jgi:hypothetical protein
MVRPTAKRLLGPALVAALAGCNGETRHDVYMKGLTIEGDAERGPCKLHYGGDSFAATLSGDQVAECLRLTEQALELYDRAAQMGLADPDFVKVHERAKERKGRLESMLRNVRQIENRYITDEGKKLQR